MSTRQRLLLVLWAAGAVSVGCNILSAEPTPVGRAVAAWPPIALLLVVEVLARSPLPTGRLRWAAVAGAGSVAVVAAVASFHHMHTVALSVGESTLVAWLFPFSVDGLAVVASVALVSAGRDTDDVIEEIVVDAGPTSVQNLEPGVRLDEPQVGSGVSLFVPPLGVQSPLSVNGNGSHETNQTTTSMG